MCEVDLDLDPSNGCRLRLPDHPSWWFLHTSSLHAWLGSFQTSNRNGFSLGLVNREWGVQLSTVHCATRSHFAARGSKPGFPLWAVLVGALPVPSREQEHPHMTARYAVDTLNSHPRLNVCLQCHYCALHHLSGTPHSIWCSKHN